jgi:hypothetical protein
MDHTLITARNRGLRLLHMACLASNGPMVRLARKFDAELRFDSGSFVGEIEPSRATTLSLIREMTADGHGLRWLLLDLQSRLLSA